MNQKVALRVIIWTTQCWSLAMEQKMERTTRWLRTAGARNREWYAHFIVGAFLIITQM